MLRTYSITKGSVSTNAVPCVCVCVCKCVYEYAIHVCLLFISPFLAILFYWPLVAGVFVACLLYYKAFCPCVRVFCVWVCGVSYSQLARAVKT